MGARRAQNEILDARISSRGYVVSGETLPTFRVEGDINRRLVLDGNNNIGLLPNQNMLFMNFAQEQRAVDFFVKRDAQSTFANPVLYSFETDSNFLLRMRLDSVPQKFGRQFPGRPQIADPTKAPDQFGIPSNYFDLLRQSIKTGSGSVR